MAEDLGYGDLGNANNCSEESGDYLKRAADACEAGDLVLGMHLYLAAYEKASSAAGSSAAALRSLREAWQLACDLRERSMAEYIFEKLEPYLTGDEIAQCAARLQELALDRLEEYGFSREELHDMAEMISEELIDSQASIVTVESISLPAMSASARDDASAAVGDGPGASGQPADAPTFEPTGAAKKNDNPRHVGCGVAPVDDFNPYDLYDTSSVGTSYHAATNEGSDAYVFTRDVDRAEQASRAARENAAREETTAAAAPSEKSDKPPAETTSRQSPAPKTLAPSAPAQTAPADSGESSGVFSYHGLAGYDEAISLMRDFGVGLEHDRGFRDFVGLLNARHGLDRMPALDTLLFRAPAIEDAVRFMEATIGEIGLPVLRMAMEENAQGMPVLSVAVQGDNRPRMNHAHNRFEGPAVLVIEELDMWVIPQPPEGVEGIGGFLMASMTRGAREAINLIRSAVEDPDVYVLVTAASHGDIEPFFYDLIEPLTIIDISNPTDKERADIWAEIARMHPSTRSLDRGELLRYSAGLSRYDIYVAARTALEEAYKTGLVQRTYQPVTMSNILDKLAGCFALDSDEYQAIEDEVVRAFGDELDDLEGLMDGSRA